VWRERLHAVIPEVGDAHRAVAPDNDPAWVAKLTRPAALTPPRRADRPMRRNRLHTVAYGISHVRGAIPCDCDARRVVESTGGVPTPSLQVAPVGGEALHSGVVSIRDQKRPTRFDRHSIQPVKRARFDASCPDSSEDVPPTSHAHDSVPREVGHEERAVLRDCEAGRRAQVADGATLTASRVGCAVIPRESAYLAGRAV
jgi:hypothetical protein